MSKRRFAVYILSSRSRVIYVGVTNDLERRVWEHKHKVIEGFTSKYNVDRLVYFELLPDVRDAIAREKELKGWKRSRKVELINLDNPLWLDLAEDWATPE